jgi:hypothetical protein
LTTYERTATYFSVLAILNVAAVALLVKAFHLEALFTSWKSVGVAAVAIISIFILPSDLRQRFITQYIEMKIPLLPFAS